MPDEMVAALERVASSMPAVDWATPEQIRHGARAGRRRRVAVTTLALLILVGGGLGLAGLSGTPSPSPGSPGPTCANGGVPVNLNIPNFSDMRVSVYSGTSSELPAKGVETELETRGLTVVRPYDPPEHIAYDGTAILRYGPAAVGSAWILRSFFLNDVETEFDPTRKVDTVDVIVGRRFENLATASEVNQAIATLGRPQAPPGTCAG